MPGDTPSNHSATLRYLRGRHLQSRRAREIAPQNIQDSFCHIVHHNSNQQQTREKLEKADIQIKKTLASSFDKEEDFDVALFTAWKKDLETRGVGIIPVNQNLFVLKESVLEHGGDFVGCGFARQARGRGIIQKLDYKSLSAVNDSRCSPRRSEYDHVCCYCTKRKDEQWRIVKCFSVVELKMSDTSSQIQWGNYVDFMQDDPIVQEVDYTLESTWPCICRMGLGKGIEYLPVALIAAHRKRKSPTSGRMRWIKGRIYLPENCGDCFGIEPNGAQAFKSGQQGPLEAAALYAETMLFGLDLCRKLKERSYAHCPPSPLCGGKLKFGSITLGDAELCGSPLLSKVQAKAHGLIAISQGELFRVRNLHLTKDSLDDVMEFNWLISTSDYGQDGATFSNLLVKVWAQSVHQCLQQPQNFDLALQRLFRAPREKAGPLIRELSSVLLGVCKTPTGTVTLMRDLTGNGIEVCLEQNPTQIGHYWESFVALVRSILLPLADLKLVHQDLRPGFDLTANILIFQDGKMRLVDFESICLVTDPRVPDQRYPENTESNPYSFLHSQCAGIAYAWIKRVKASDFKMEAARVWVEECSLGACRTAQDVQKLLQGLGEVIKAPSQATAASLQPVADDDDNNNNRPTKTQRRLTGQPPPGA